MVGHSLLAALAVVAAGLHGAAASSIERREVSLNVPRASSGTGPFYGEGTRYGDSCKEEDCWQGGACSFVDYELPPGIDGSTCFSDAAWDNGGKCGGCVAVTYKGKTLKIMVTNMTGGNGTNLDMTPSTWAKLTNNYSGGGVGTVEWNWIPCPFTEPQNIWIKMHGGASKYWFAATVENALYRTTKLEVSSDGGKTWKATNRETYNMYVLSGTLPSDTASVRVTSVNGDSVVVNNVQLKSGQITKGTTNYAA